MARQVRTERTIRAECQTCDWTTHAPNARATAATHARTKSHDVTVTETVRHPCAGPMPGQTSLDDHHPGPEPAPAGVGFRPENAPTPGGETP